MRIARFALALSALAAVPTLDVAVFRLVTGNSDSIEALPKAIALVVAFTLPAGFAILAVRSRSPFWLYALGVLLLFAAGFPFFEGPPHSSVTGTASPLQLWASGASLAGATFVLLSAVLRSSAPGSSPGPQPRDRAA